VTVRVVMHGTLRRFLPVGAASAILDLRPGITIGGLLAGLGADQDTWLVARNQAIAERDAVLAPGDVLDCFEPLAGGAGGETPRAAGRLPEELCRSAT
jgi:sulfur carrier protein ThiS